MSIDLSEFHDIFFEECFEGLSVMESGLLTLDNGTDVEEINSIFRAAHSIKGGGASFGFMDISNFTHVMETLLDEMRDGRREVTQPIVDLLLESVDVLQEMVTAAKDGEESDTERTAKVHKKLEAMLAGESADAEKEAIAVADTKEETAAEKTEASGWQIKFKPHPDMIKGGNDPARIFRELQNLADMTITVDVSELPAFCDLEPESSYLGWTLELRGDVQETEIRELFSWVEDESDLEITPLDTAAPKEAINEDQEAADNAVEQQTLVTEEAKSKLVVEEKSSTKVKPETKKTKPASASKESGSIRVSIDKIDELINMVGELVITQSMLSQISSSLEEGTETNLEKLLDGITQLERNTRELQESVLQIRMLPISFSFSRFPRLVRDLSKKMGKKIELKMIGEQTEVDKTVLEKIGDPLVHLVRNSLDHGIETPDIRTAAGKPETGTLELHAYHEGGDIIIKVIDDGAGLNREKILQKAIEKGLVNENEEISDERIYNLIFQPGFSTADQVSDVSGRGVGMDVVRRNIRDLGGNVSIDSNDGAGSTVTIRLPLTLAILDGQLVQIGEETYIVSLVSIIESLQMVPESINSITGQSDLYRLRNEYIPIIRVNELFGMKSGTTNLHEGLLVVVEADGMRVGLFVDDLLGQQQVVIKSLETNFKQIQGISGATILGDGTVALIMDVPGLIQRHFETQSRKNRLTAVA
ncbi:MAG TPA: chemotaxis protein CheA [Chromatiales bacterium]|nr:chemotaxis protein CheA [Thiotrichales bacterium]HIP67612.1 chemotaxis protein CheA [Chromatiales bacterium]